MSTAMPGKRQRIGPGSYAVWAMGLAVLGVIMLTSSAHAAGTLTPKGSADQPIRILSHHVDVVINNSFARTEVIQTFQNPNAVDLEGIYEFPVPKHGSLSEMTIWAGEKEFNGEVLAKKEADRIYEEEKQQGNDAGKAEKNSYQTFKFYVHPIRANSETKVRFVYYQPLPLDTGIGRYVYPLEPGGTDERAMSFWTHNQKVEGQFSVKLTLKSACPVADVRAPGYEAAAKIQKHDEGHVTLEMQTSDAALNRDFVFYYRLADNLPGRIEVIPYRVAGKGSGTFMMVVTPGIDLKPLNRGADYIYILDKSGSMQGGKIRKLTDGVTKAIGAMRAGDRFRVIMFDSAAREMTSGWVPATADNARAVVAQVSRLQAGGSTNIYAGLKLAVDKLDDDRATSIVLVTDGVTNTGVIAPKAFHELLKKYDVRVFGFVMGNSANWPLMQLIGRASGGFSASVSNDDDIVGQIMLAKSKITHECLHDARIKISGVRVSETTDEYVGKVYRGQQLVLFGRYDKPGRAKVSLQARLTGEDKTYTTEFDFPEVDTDNPEVERLWALNQIEQYKARAALGLLPECEVEDIERDLGVKYQLVTDETTMVVLDDAAFERHGVERRNRVRVANERKAQAVRMQQPARNYRVDRSTPAFPGRAPRLPNLGGGGGALDPLSVTGVLSLLTLAWYRRRRGRRSA